MRFSLLTGVLVSLALGAIAGRLCAEPRGAPAPVAQPNVSATATLPYSAPPSPDRIAVMIELEGDPAAVTFARELEAAKGRGLSNPQQTAISLAKAQFERNRVAQDRLALRLKEPETLAEPMYFVRRALNGIAIFTSPKRLDAIRRLPGVHRLLPMMPSKLQTSRGLAFIGTPQFWTATGLTGAGIKVALVDSGLDYTHTDFGGSGNAADYQNNDRTIIGDIPGFPSARIYGGVDLAGDTYDGTNIPVPDPDPVDCLGHGTGVAGVLAGSGVLSDGSTYTGPYDSSISSQTFRIVPGVAPEALIYVIKVGGCVNLLESYLVAQGIDRALDPNDDGDMSDRVDVINLSIGNGYGSPIAPDTIATDNAALAGVIPVSASANEGDFHYILGAPGNAARAITAAGSVDDGVVHLDLAVHSPVSIAGNYEVAPAAFGSEIDATGVTGNVAYESSLDACSIFPNNGSYAGKIALIEPDFCTFTLQAANAEAAGAIGVVLIDPYSGPIFGPTGFENISIPVAMISRTDGTAIRDAIALGPVNATLSASIAYPQTQYTDTSALFTSRGPSQRDSALKPDLSAPAFEIVYPQVGTGNRSSFSSGTSFAAPFTAGGAALAHQFHPDWTVEEIKALLMNTAVHDVYNDTFGSLPPNYVTLAGAGRIDLVEAMNATVIAYNPLDPGAVSVSFGAPEFIYPGSMERTIRVVNKGANPVTLTPSAARVTVPPGVQFAIEAPSSLNVPANDSMEFNVRITADPALMKHVPDPHLNLMPQGFSRHWLTEMSGFVELTSATHRTLRVPVYAAPRPAGRMLAVQPSLDLPASLGPLRIDLAGVQVNGGPSQPIDELGLVMPMELQYSSSAANDPTADEVEILHSGVRRILGAGGGVANTDLVFGIALRSPWHHPLVIAVSILVDIDENGTDDFRITLLGPGSEWDAPRAYAENLTSSALQADFPLNGFDPSIYDTVPLNNSVREYLVRASALGLTDANSRFNYHIETDSLRFPGEADATPTLSYDAAAPGLDFPFYTYFDLNGNFIDATFDPAAFAANASLGLLLLHHHNAEGLHAEALLPRENSVRDWEWFD